MTSITVLGAGAMGSALCVPLVKAGMDVRLWGTWLDDHLIDAIEAGKPHPRINVKIIDGVKTFRSDQLAEAMDGADVVVMAVASVGVPKVLEMALPGIAKAKAMWCTTKGFITDDNGKIELLPTGMRRIAKANGVELPPLVCIAGPVKANECAAQEPTATIFGCTDIAVAKQYAGEARTDRYCIEYTDDEVGVEICAPMKNVYAIALGIADGLEEKTGVPHHNMKAATFTRAVKEMSLLGEALGAKSETAFGLPGVGDLEVTGLSGRNKVYGVRIGRGEPAKEALEEMARLEQTVEGAAAIHLAVDLVEQSAPQLKSEMRLMYAVKAILDGNPNYEELVIDAVLPAAP